MAIISDQKGLLELSSRINVKILIWPSYIMYRTICNFIKFHQQMQNIC